MAHRAMGMEPDKAQQRRLIRNNFSLTLGALVFALTSSAGAQQPARVPRIGFLSATSPTIIASRVAAFRQGLGDLGYVESKNILTEYRFAQGNLERLRKLAAELVGLKLDAIVTAGPTVTRPVKEATSTIPIIMTFDDDPVGSGYAASLARPGANITGLSILAPEISGKQLELLKDIIPKLKRVAVLASAIAPDRAQTMNEMESAAKALRLELKFLDVSGPQDVEPAFHTLANRTPGALVVLAGPTVIRRMTQITGLS